MPDLPPLLPTGNEFERLLECLSKPSKLRGFEEVSNKFCHALPTRATKHSAGYDLYIPRDILLTAGKQELVWLNIKAYMQPDEVLMIHMRSSIGIKQGVILANTTGVIDSDYYNNPDNEGNIGLCLKNNSNNLVFLPSGTKVAQGVFMKYLLADADEASEDRVSGIGSTD